MDIISYEKFKIYKKNFTDVDFKTIIDEAIMTWNVVWPNSHQMTGNEYPGIQIPTYMMSGTKTSQLLDRIIKEAEKIFIDSTGITPNISYIRPWFFISSKYNKNSSFHTHHDFGLNISPAFTRLKTHLTGVFYLDVPEKEEEGEIVFRINQDTPKKDYFSFKPKQGDFVIFSPFLQHKPELNQTSKKTRFVLAFNCHFDTTVKPIEPGLNLV